jgi:hypothetical protein
MLRKSNLRNLCSRAEFLLEHGLQRIADHRSRQAPLSNDLKTKSFQEPSQSFEIVKIGMTRDVITAPGTIDLLDDFRGGDHQTRDGIHLNAAGYNQWRDAYCPTFARRSAAPRLGGWSGGAGVALSLS